MARVAVIAVTLACSGNDKAGTVAPGQGGNGVAEGGRSTAGAAGGTSVTPGGGASATPGGGASATDGGAAGDAGASGSPWLDVPGLWSEPQLLDMVGDGGALWAARNEDGSALAIWRVGGANIHRFALFRAGEWSPAQDFDTGFAESDPRLDVRIVPGPPATYYVQLNDVIRPFKDGAWQPAIEVPEVQAFDVDDQGQLLVAFLRTPPPGSTYKQLYVGFQDDLDGAFLLEGVQLPANVAVRALPGGQWLAAANGNYRSFDGAAWSEPAKLSAPIDRDHASFGSGGRLWTIAGYDVWTYTLEAGFQRSAKLAEVADYAEQQVVPIGAERAVVLYTQTAGNPYLRVAAGEVGLSGAVMGAVVVGKGGGLWGTSDLRGGNHFTYELGAATGMLAGIYTQRYLAERGWSRPILLLPRFGAKALNSVNIVLPHPDGSAEVILRTQDNNIKTAHFAPSE